jgi:hypothetical protein
MQKPGKKSLRKFCQFSLEPRFASLSTKCFGFRFGFSELFYQRLNFFMEYLVFSPDPRPEALHELFWIVSETAQKSGLRWPFGADLPFSGPRQNKN